MNRKQIYKCQNPACRSEAEFAQEQGGNPRCACGAEMKKPYRKPTLRTLHANYEATKEFKTVSILPY